MTLLCCISNEVIPSVAYLLFLPQQYSRLLPDSLIPFLSLIPSHVVHAHHSHAPFSFGSKTGRSCGFLASVGMLLSPLPILIPTYVVSDLV
jgi:hypothetical protein